MSVAVCCILATQPLQLTIFIRLWFSHVLMTLSGNVCCLNRTREFFNVRNIMHTGFWALNFATVFGDLEPLGTKPMNSVQYRCLGSRVVSVLDSGAEGPGFKSQLQHCRVTVLGSTPCLCSTSSKIGSFPFEGCEGNCGPGRK